MDDATAVDAFTAVDLVQTTSAFDASHASSPSEVGTAPGQKASGAPGRASTTVALADDTTSNHHIASNAHWLSTVNHSNIVSMHKGLDDETLDAAFAAQDHDASTWLQKPCTSQYPSASPGVVDAAAPSVPCAVDTPCDTSLACRFGISSLY